MVAAGNHYGETVLGFREARDGRVVLDPAKSELFSFDESDEVVAVTTRSA